MILKLRYFFNWESKRNTEYLKKFNSFAATDKKL